MTEAILIDGKAMAADIVGRLERHVSTLKDGRRKPPGLAVVLLGEDPASQVYVRTKKKRAEGIGIASFLHELPAETTEKELLFQIQSLNDDEDVHGILVQLPLPSHIDAGKVIQAVDPAKDVDGFHPVNAGLLATGSPEAMAPCTPLGCLRLLESHLGRKRMAGLKAVVLGRSNIVGKPMAQLLLQADCTVTIAHSRTLDAAAECRAADILVAAVGRPSMVKGDWIKPGATVIDVGINRIKVMGEEEEKAKLVGDVDFNEAKGIAGAITPVPGGVGPMTIAMLLRNTVLACARRRRISLDGFDL